jgi:peptide/nickel transport system permease protein
VIRLESNPSLRLGGAIVALLLGVAICGPFAVRLDPLAVELSRSLARASARHPFGCDALGRDILARVVWGARLSLEVSLSVVTVCVIAGSLAGAVAALAGGWTERLIMRAVDIVLAFPGFLLAIALAAILGPGLGDLMIALAAMGWTGYARLVRGELLSLREREHVEAARALGARPARLFLYHLLPALLGPLAVQASFSVGGIIVAEAALSFLGLGILPPSPSWGNMLESGRAFLLVAPQLTAAPGIAIGLAVLGFNLLGDGLAQRFGQR